MLLHYKLYNDAFGEELRRYALHWRCHAACEGERPSPEALKTQKAYKDMIQYGTKGPRADQLRRQYQQALAEARVVELREADIVFSTCISSRRMAIAQALSEDGAPTFWQVILDEAGQATEPEALCPMTFARGAQQICLFGDQQQLRPILKSSLAEAHGMAMSLFERLAERKLPQFLAIQYRMKPGISAFPSRQFYQGRLQDDVSVKGSPALLRHPSKHFPMSLMAWDMGSGGEHVHHTRTVESGAGSRMNEAEAQNAVALAVALAELAGPKAVGILCWYRAQVARISELLTEMGLDIHVGSVATAQGSEWDYVLLSTVRRGSKRLGILADPHILNVALTRARRGLVILGHRSTLSEDVNWKAFYDFCETSELLLQEMPGITDDEQLRSEAWARALVPGTKVEVVNLKKQAELNGKLATVVCLANDRWEVELQGETRRLALKPSNLGLVRSKTSSKMKFGGLNALVEADRPRSGVEFSTTLHFAATQLAPPPPSPTREVRVVDEDSPCHGMQGTLLKAKASDTYAVEFTKCFEMQQGPVRPGKKGLEVSAPSSVQHLLKPGLVVMLHGLKNKPELNAEWARIVSQQANDDGRWEVDLLQIGAVRRLSMKPDNLAPEV